MEGNMRALVSAVLLEKDVHGDVLPIWSFPDISSQLSEVVVARSGLQHETIPLQYSFSRFGSQWIYSFIQIKSEDSELSEQVDAIQVSLVATDFNPEKYVELTKLMANLYIATGTPLKVAECWLSVFAKGSYNGGEFGVFSSSQHDPRNAFIASSIKDVIRLFGEDIVLIWSALMMKKRIVVVGSKMAPLLKVCRALPTLVWHRQNWDIVRPFVLPNDNEIEDLKESKVYVAGFTDDSIRDREDLYDILVDINNRSVTVSSSAQGDFLMSVIHKGICDFLVASGENSELADTDVIRGTALKVKDLLQKLEQLKVENENGESYVDLKTLQNTKLPANVDRFLFAVATAEGMTAMTA
eukprot:TRINITY_DN3358_c0_g1_i1.p1 TRINITY_DN3358_c0_g1~~TRINITY_DN3358_c0_g1_i1.p1  ORF type:complete len:355 (-),score=111.44 TRINITY_DN3358_c0_g1_i1:39-1103(-)